MHFNSRLQAKTQYLLPAVLVLFEPITIFLARKVKSPTTKRGLLRFEGVEIVDH
jgi:hypothetical protein